MKGFSRIFFHLLTLTWILSTIWILPIRSSTSTSTSNSPLGDSNSTLKSVVWKSDGNQTTGTTVVSTTSSPVSDQSAADRGLSVLYLMTAKFLDVIQPPGKNLYDELNLKDALSSKDVMSALLGKAQDPKLLMRYFVGFMVCVAFGVVFIIILPLVGFFLCICRCCCHKCGHEKTPTPEQSQDKMKRIVLGAILLLFTIIILAGAICSFMSNDLVRQRTSYSGEAQQMDSRSDQSGSLLTTVLNSLEEIDRFKESTLQEVRDLLSRTNSSLYRTINKVYAFPDRVSRYIIQLIGPELIDSPRSFNSTIFQFIEVLERVEVNSVRLQSLCLNLNDTLTGIQKNITDLCHPETTSTPICNVPDLSIGTDLSQIPNVSALLTIIKALVGQGINTSIFDERVISNRIQTEFQPVFDAVSRIDISGIVQNVKTSIESNAKSLPSLKPVADNIKSCGQKVQEYGNYRFYVCVAISAFLLLVVVLFSLGLCIGACTDPPYDMDSKPFISRWTAGYCLLASVALIFIFCLFLMIVVIVLFVSGGVVYTEGCRGFDTRQNITVVKIADFYLASYLDNVTLYGILNDCNQNSGIVKALNLDQTYNISGRFNLQELDNFDLDKRFNASSTDLSQFDLSGPRTELEILRNFTYYGLINTTALDEQLSKNLTSSHIREAIEYLNSTAENMTDRFSNEKTQLRYYVQQLQDLSDNEIPKIVNATTQLRDSLKDLDNSTKELGDFMTNLLVLMNNTENRIKTELPDGLQQLIANFSSEVKTDLEATIDGARREVMTSVGRCRPLSNALENTVFGFCHSTLDPYNAFWFSYGWSLFFFIPAIAVAVSLATLYLRSDDVFDHNDIFAYNAYKSQDVPEYHQLNNLSNARQDHVRPQDPSAAIRQPQNVNPGYVDSVPRNHGNNASGLNFYQGVGHHGNGSYENRSYDDNERSNYRIPRPATDTYNSTGSSSHRF